MRNRLLFLLPAIAFGSFLLGRIDAHAEEGEKAEAKPKLVFAIPC